MRRPSGFIGQFGLSDLQSCGGVYICPKSNNIESERLGPLVGYAGKYESDEGPKNWVGDIYYNFAMAERHPRVLKLAATDIHTLIGEYASDTNCVLGAPMGGIALAFAVASAGGYFFGFAEKKVTKASSGGEREESELVLDRHLVEPGWKVVLVEDVCNNFSTTDKLVRLVHERGAEVVAIACAVNRSELRIYEGHYGLEVPVLASVVSPTQQWKQDDPFVAGDIAKGNIVWKPKDSWAELLQAQGV